MESVTCEPVYFDVPLGALLTRCNSMAHRFWRQQGRWEPLEEYLSAGHLAIAQCIQSYDPAQAPPGGFKSYCIFQMAMKMRDVRIKAAGSNNMRKPVKGERRDPKYEVEHWDDHALLYNLRTEQARQETTVYLHEVLTYLEPQGKPAAMLFATALGVPVEEVADTWQCSMPNVTKHCVKLRRKLRTWAHWSAA